MKLIDVCKKYTKNKRETIALKNINIAFENAGLYLIYGHSGSGKTTLLNLMAKFDKPTMGEIENDYGKDCVSLIFQDYQLIDYLTVYENLKYVCDIYNISYLAIDEYVKRYQIEDILNHYPNEISGGEKQRCAVARAFLSNKPIILCDEPTGNLDEDNAIIIAKSLKEESKKHIVVVVSHDKDLFSQYSDQIIHMSKGEIVEITPLKSNQKLLEYSFNKAIFNFKNQLYLMTRFLNKNIIKHIYLIMTLIFSFFLMLASLSTITNSYSKVLNNISKDEGINQLDFAKKSSGDTFKRQTYSDLQEQSDSFDNCGIYYDIFLFDIENIYSSRTYIANNTKNEIITGVGTLNDNEILISDYIALNTGLSFDKLINQVYSGCKIVGIYNTGFYNLAKDLTTSQIKNLTLEQNYIDRQYSSIYITKNTFESIIKGVDEYSANISLSGYITQNYISKEYTKEPLYGEISTLNDGEIAISKALASEYAENLDISIENLIGEEIELKFCLTYNNFEIPVYYTKEFIVKYIGGGSSMSFYTIMSNNDFNDGALIYNSILNNSDNGIYISDYDSKDIEKILQLGYIDDMAISNKLSNGVGWLEPLKYVMLGLALIMLIISLVVIMNFIHVIFEKEKGVQGLLASFGVAKNKIILMYLLVISVLLVGSILLALILQIPFIHAINAILISQIGSFGVLYFEGISLIYIIGIFFILLLLIYHFLQKKINKKEVIDIIYQR